MLFSIYVLILVYPNPLFAHKHEFKQFTVHSDQEIPNEIEQVLDLVTYKISQSELYNQDLKFNIFVCNDNWRFKFLTRNPNAAGLVHFVLSRNVFVRSCDIVNDKIIPPDTWKFGTEDRSMNWLLSHELTHSMQSYHDRFMVFKTSVPIIEGYADYIGKFDTFDFLKYQKDFRENHVEMDPANGLYKKYHLFVADFIDNKGYSFLKLVEESPDLNLIEELRKN